MKERSSKKRQVKKLYRFIQLYRKFKENKGSQEAYTRKRSEFRSICENKKKKNEDDELEEVKNAKSEKDIRKCERNKGRKNQTYVGK